MSRSIATAARSASTARSTSSTSTCQTSACASPTQTRPGTGGTIAAIGDLNVGLTICYDLRFPELYRAYAVAGVTVVTVPAAFLERTGRDHWEVLLRARAIENQCWVVAANQHGKLPAGLTAYGRSMIVDPWGTVVAQAPDGQGVIVAECDDERVARVRAAVPSLAHRRPEAYDVPT